MEKIKNIIPLVIVIGAISHVSILFFFKNLFPTVVNLAITNILILLHFCYQRIKKTTEINSSETKTK